MSEALQSRLAGLTPAQRALYELALKKKEQQKAAAPSPATTDTPVGPRAPRRRIPRHDYGDQAPLSIDQERLWFIQQLDPASPVYNVYSATRYKVRLEMRPLQQAVDELVRRHEIFRTTFPSVDGRPVQRIHPHTGAAALHVDLRGLPVELREGAAERAANQVVTPAFDLLKLPMLRIMMIQVHDDDFVMPNCIHHILSDRVSYDFINVELFTLYEAFRQGLPSPLPEPEIQFADFAIWQREHLESPEMAEQIDYWKKRLEGAPDLLALPADRPRPPIQTPWGARRSMMLTRQQADAFKALSAREEVTHFIGGLALFKAFLVRLTGQEKLIVGTPMDYRQGPEMEGAQGFYLNQLALYTDLTGNPTVHEVVQRVRETAIGAYDHHDLPFAKVVELLRPQRDLSRIPFTQVVFLLITPHTTFGNLKAESIAAMRPFWVDARRTQFDMTFAIFWQDVVDVGAIWEYNTDLFDHASVNRWKEQFRAFWNGFVADPQTRLWDLPLLTEPQRQQLLLEWNDVEAGGTAAPLVPGRIAAQAARTPEALAVAGLADAGRLTYAELERRASRLAGHLRRLGIGAEDLVAVCQERSPDLAVSLLGVWKAGAAYLPLDPAHPAERSAAILADAGARALLVDPPGLERLAGALPEGGPRRILLGPGGLDLGVSEAEAAEAAEPLGDAAAYVLYTSGSTGTPKGVQVSHGALASFVRAAERLYPLGPEDVWLAVTTVTFDISALELYLPLVRGARVVLADRETTADGALLGRALAETGATVMQATPSGWRLLLDSGWTGSPGLRLLCGGEALPRDLADRLLPAGRELWNQYGPTEATIWSTSGRVGPGDGPLPLGRPLANTRVYVLDRDLRPVPQGTTGEVFIGGDGLARGYLGRPDLTAERFVPDPATGERLYRTGDLARHLPDGSLTFLGRADGQIKLRGHRIELGEIEAALRRHPAVSDATVTLQGEGSRDGRLVAFLVLRPSLPEAPEGLEVPEPGALQAFLRQGLPEPMVPSAFVTLEALPLNRAGKVDRKALERMAPGGALRPRLSGIAPRTSTEEALAAIWKEILGPDRTAEGLGVYDDFFALGGHSLLATQLVARIRDVFDVELPIRSVFQVPTIAAQATLVESAESAQPRGEGRPAGPGPVRRQPRDPAGATAPLSFAQERLWFLDRLVPGLAVYNMPLAIRVLGKLDVPALERTFAELVRRHESLRTTFLDVAGQPVQWIAPAAGWTLPVTDLSGSADPHAEAERLAAEAAVEPFDLSQGPLLRTRLLRLGPDEHMALLAIHHIVADLWSMGVLVREVTELYPLFAAGEPSRLPELPVQYADFAAWQRDWLQGDELERQLAFWRRHLVDAPAALDLPADRPRPAVQSFRGGSILWHVSPELVAGLNALAQRQGTTLFMALMAACSTLLGRLAVQEDVVLGFPIANRRRPELEGLIGMFVNTLPLRLPVAGSRAFSDLLAGVREISLEAFDHQDVPFEKIVEDLQPRRDPSRHPLFQATLSVQNVPLHRVELTGIALEPVPAESALTKFDLSLTATEAAGQLGGRVEYAADLFDAATVERWMSHLRTLLAAAVLDPDRPLAELSLLAEEERRQLLLDWGRNAAYFPCEATIHGTFAAQAQRSPDAVAVVCGAERRTYRELREQAGRLARRLRAAGVGEGGDETRVGLLAHRTPDLIAGLLGILEAGGAYLPLDPSYPPERLQFVLGEAAVPVLVAERSLLDGPLGGAEVGRRVVELEDLQDLPQEAPAFAPIAEPDRLAYVMYTSGSTGEPKGVAVTHRNVVRLVRSAGAAHTYMAFGPERTFLQLAPIAFDASTLEVWGPLLNGGRLVQIPAERASLDDLAEAVSGQGVDTLWLTAGLFQQIVDHRLDALRGVAQLLAGGDVLSAPHARRALEELPGLALINGYGPTEGTTFTCCHRMTAPPAEASLPIGRPVANARVHVLDRLEGGLRPVPVGVAGELYVGGDGLARGYLERPDLTAERFLPDPFADKGERLYRTGDLARWRPDGTLDFLGRNDTQVKIRGFRVELAEVEEALLRHPQVRQAAVLAVEEEIGGVGGKALMAFVVPREGQTGDLPNELKDFLRAWLPDPMVPSGWLELDDLPLTPNGKVDRRALLALSSGTRIPGQRAAYVAPRTALEEHLVEVCAEVLKQGQVGIHDNFFELGGHSLLATQFVVKLKDRLGIEVPLQAVFDTADLEELADRITDLQLSQADDEALEAAMAELGEE